MHERMDQGERQEHIRKILETLPRDRAINQIHVDLYTRALDWLIIADLVADVSVVD